MTFISEIETFFSKIFTALKPSLKVFAEEGAADALALAQKEIQDFRDKKTWAEMFADLKTTLVADGKQFENQFIAIIMNFAESNLIANGTIPAPTPAAAPAVNA